MTPGGATDVRALAGWIMRGRLQAVTVAVVGTLAAFLLPPLTSPLSYLGSGAIGLVTLRRGAWEGLTVLGLGLALLGVVGQLAAGVGAVTVVSGGLFWLPVWGAALVLRTTVSWAATLTALVAAGLGMLAAFHLALGDPAAWWQQTLGRLLAEMPASSQSELLGRALEALSRWMTALLASAFLVGVVLSLLLARAWQAMLYNPGGLAREFEQLRLGRGMALAMPALALLAMTGEGALARWAADATLIVGLAWLVQGLAVIHAVRRVRGLHRGWLVLVYGLLLFVEPHAALVIAVLGWLDGWMDFRNRVLRRSGGGHDER